MRSLFSKIFLSAFILALTVSFVSIADGPSAQAAEEYYCEAMTVEGTARVSSGAESKTLKQGDLLKAGDILEVDANSHVDLAFDREWNNISRVGENSKVTIKSVFPTGLKLDAGDIFARLSKLPKGSTFEIQTPTAVAAARGTVYWTEFTGGKTSVYNYSPSPVEVFNLDSQGNIQERVVVTEHQKTEIPRLNEPPAPPVKMSETDMQKAGTFDKGIQNSVKDTMDAGREGHAPSINDMEQKTKEHLEAATKDAAEHRPAGDDKRPVSGPGGPGNGDSTGTGTNNPNQGPNSLTAAGEPTAAGSAPGTATPPPAAMMPPPTAPQPPAIPTMPSSMEPKVPEPPTMPNMDSIQNKIDSAVNTVNQTVATQANLLTTAPPGTAGPNMPPLGQKPCGPAGSTTQSPSATAPC